jgi:uncharacterized protein YjbJ (UPF0337 family)
MLLSQVTIPSLLKAYVRKLTIIFITTLLMVFAWANIFFDIDDIALNAHAATVEGMGNQTQGKVEKDLGNARYTIEDSTDDKSGEIKGRLQQAKGKVTQDIGTGKNKLDNVKNKAENKSKTLIDSVKDFFE